MKSGSSLLINEMHESRGYLKWARHHAWCFTYLILFHIQIILLKKVFMDTHTLQVR